MEKLYARLGLLTLAIVSAAIVVYLQQPRALEKARAAEQAGSYRDAQQLYAEAIVAHAPTVEFPNKNTARSLPPPAWKKQVAAFVDRLTAPPGAPKQAHEAAAGALRCTSEVKQLSFTTLPTVTSADPAAYRDLWEETFFPGLMKIDESHVPLLERAYDSSLSIVRIHSRKSYGYEGILLERSTGHAVAFRLYQDHQTYLPARPGEHLLVASAVATFPSGGTWRSPYSIISLTVPEQPSLVAFTMNTVVEKDDR